MKKVRVTVRVPEPADRELAIQLATLGFPIARLTSQLVWETTYEVEADTPETMRELQARALAYVAAEDLVADLGGNTVVGSVETHIVKGAGA